MKLCLIFTLFIFSTNSLLSQEKRFNDEYGVPIIVLTVTDPWLMIIGSDVPSFALYENGQIIYKKIVDRKEVFYIVKLDRDQTQSIIKSFGITDSLINMEKYTEAIGRTDQPTNHLFLNFEKPLMKSVYGYLNNENNPARKNVPNSFLTVFDKLLKFTHKNGKKWIPEKVELLVSRYSHSPEKPVHWPNKWPNLDDSTSIKRHEDLYSIYIDKEFFPDFLESKNSLKEKQAFEINGEKFAVYYRFPFPNF